MAIYGNAAIPLSIQGTLTSNAISSGAAIPFGAQGIVQSVALTGSIPITLSNQVTADWPATGTQTGWEITAEQFVYAPGLEITIPAPSFSATGHDSALGILSSILPSFGFSAVGSDAPIGVLSIPIPSSGFYARGSVGQVGRISISLPVLSFHAEGGEGAVGTLSITILTPEWDASGHLSAEGTLEITIPAPHIDFVVTPITDAFLNMVLNIHNFSLTNFTNYDFNSLCRFNGVSLGATATGIFDLDSNDKDDADLIEWNFRFGYLDLEHKTKKRITQAWLSYKSSGDLIATIITPSGDSWEYPVEAVNNTENGIRVVFGKGIKSKYVALDVKNTDGSDITLDTVRFHFDQYNKPR